MENKLVIIITFACLYGFFEMLISFIQRRKSIIIKSEDKGSIWFLFICIGLGYWLSFSLKSIRIGRIDNWNTFFIIGTILAIICLIVRITSIMTLREHFTYTVTKIENYELIEKGLYKIIRHPGYLGQLIIFLGISISLSNWLSIISLIVPVIIGFIYRINIEEKFMLKQMGTKYKDYQARTNKLIPKLY
jgi:protein-S-isoprenylcysteine O-methyltransferase Ste14